MLAPEIQASWDRLHKERAALIERFKREFGHTPQGEGMPQDFGESTKKLFAELDALHSGTHLDPDKTDRTIDRIIGESKARGKYARGMRPQADETPDGIETPKKRGRPKGSKNKPKTQLVSPEQIGSIPDPDIVILRRG